MRTASSSDVARAPAATPEAVEPLVSIVIDNFNYARYLPRSIESALAQTWSRVEVIVVDDASTDGSPEVIARYADRVVPVLQERNGGQGAALNAGFRASRGEVVMFLDADDWLYPDAAARVVGAFAPGVGQVQFRLDLVDRDERRIDVYPPPEVRFDSGDVVPLLLRAGRYENTVTSGNAFARGTLERILPVPAEDFRISADGYLVTVSPFHGAVSSIDEPLGAYRQHGGNAWAAARGAGFSEAALAERLRRVLAHDVVRLRALEGAARACGRAVRPDAVLRDPQHLQARLASLRLDRARHPHPGDRAFALALRGVVAAARARTSLGRRAVLAAWFLATGLAPRPLAVRAAAWRLEGGSRPPAVDRLLKKLRALVR
jgi:hypothetical protein